MTSKGEGTARDFAEAIKWYQRAADQGYQPAQTALQSMDGSVTGTVRSAVVSQLASASRAQTPSVKESKMTDVATYCGRKLMTEAMFGIIFGTVVLAIVPLIVFFVHEEVATRHGSWGLLVMGLVPLILGYVSFSKGARRFEAASTKNCWLKASSEGISMRLPYGADSKKFFLSNPVVECVIPWSDVITYYTLQRKINGLPFGKELVIETRRHGKFRLGGYFKQHPDIIQTVPRDAALSH